MAQGRRSEEPEEIRKRLRASKKAIDEEYIRMGRDLYQVYHRRLFVGWGHDTFDDFVAHLVFVFTLCFALKFAEFRLILKVISRR